MAPPAPKITKVIQTAADWPVWLTQVNTRLMSLNLHQFLSINEDGDLELNAPKAPMKASDGGPPDRRIRLPAEHGVLQSPEEREHLEYMKMRNEYLVFMLEVERSISREIGFDVDKEGGFGELIRKLRAHLGMDRGGTTAAPVIGPEDQWNILMQQGLQSMPVEDWGERLITMYRTSIDSGIDRTERSWKPHTEFVMRINTSYPNLGGVTYASFDKMRMKHGEVPRKRCFEKLVRFTVEMIARLGESPVAASSQPKTQAKLSLPEDFNDPAQKVVINLVSDDDSSKTPKIEPTLSTRKRRRQEESPQSEARPCPTKKRAQLGHHDHVWSPIDSPQTPGLFVTGNTPGRGETPGNNEGPTTPEATQSVAAPSPRASTYVVPVFVDSSPVTSHIKRKETNAKSKAPKPATQKNQLQDPFSSIPAPENTNSSNNPKSADNLDPKTNATVAKPAARSKSKAPNLKKEAGPRCGACEASGHGTEACQLLILYRMYGEKTACLPEWVKNTCRLIIEQEKQRGEGCRVCLAKDHATEVCAYLEVYKQHGNAGNARMPKDIKNRCEEWFHAQNENETTAMKSPNPLAPKETPNPAPRRKASNPPAPKKTPLPTVPKQAPLSTVPKNIPLATAQKNTPHPTAPHNIPHAIAPRNTPHPTAPADIRHSTVLQKPPHVTAPTNAVHPTALTNIPRLTAPRRNSNPRQSCYVCQGVGHEAEDCDFLWKHRQNGGTNGGVPWLMLNRCMQLPLPESERLLIESGQLSARCYICREETSHETVDCQMLKAHLGGDGSLDRPMSAAHIQRCITWLVHEGRPAAPKAQHGTPTRCSICGMGGHTPQSCIVLDMYEEHGENAKGLDNSTKKRCRDWLRNARSSSKMTPWKAVPECEICGLHGHASGDCELMRLYRESGEKASIGVVHKEKCRNWLQKLGSKPQKSSSKRRGGSSPNKSRQKKSTSRKKGDSPAKKSS